MGRLLLIDNDALLKLASYGLLDEVVGLFGCTSNDVRVLATAKYSLLPAKNRLCRCRDQESAARLEAFLKISKPLDVGSANLNLLDMLNAVQNIDAGEALLLAVGATNENSLVITGDKRSLAALVTCDFVASISKALANRVISMEVLFLHLVDHQFAHVQECVRFKPNVDKALSIAFGVAAPADIDSVREGLTSYIKHLHNVVGVLLYASPG